MTGLVTGGFIIPAFCGPLGILPLRIRGRLACAVTGKSDVADLLEGGQVSLTLPRGSGYRMTR